MSELIQQAGMALSSGQFDEAMALFEKAREAEPENAVAHYGWAESAFMRLSMDMAEDVPAGKIMQVYKKAMQLDEENLEYERYSEESPEWAKSLGLSCSS